MYFRLNEQWDCCKHVNHKHNFNGTNLSGIRSVFYNTCSSQYAVYHWPTASIKCTNIALYAFKLEEKFDANSWIGPLLAFRFLHSERAKYNALIDY